MKYSFNLKSTNNIIQGANAEIDYKIVNGIEDTQQKIYKMNQTSCIDFYIKFNNFGNIDLIKELYFTLFINYPKIGELRDLNVAKVNELLEEKKFYENLTPYQSWTDLDGIMSNDLFCLFKIPKESYGKVDNICISDLISYSKLFDDTDNAIYFDIYNLFKENPSEIYFRIFMDSSKSPISYFYKKDLLDKYKNSYKEDLNSIFGIIEIDLKSDSKLQLDNVILNNTSFVNILPINKYVTDITILDVDSLPIKLNYIYNQCIDSCYYTKYKLLSNLHCFIEKKDIEIYLKDAYGNEKVYYKVNPNYINSQYGLSLSNYNNVYFNFSDLSYIYLYTNEFDYYSNDIRITYKVQQIDSNNDHNQQLKLFRAEQIIFSEVQKYTIVWENGLVVNIIDDYNGNKILRCNFTDASGYKFFIEQINIKEEMNLIFDRNNFYLKEIELYQKQIGKLVNESLLLNNKYTYDSNNNIIDVFDVISNNGLKVEYDDDEINIDLYKLVNNEVKNCDFKNYVKYDNYVEISSLTSVKNRIYFDKNNRIFLYENNYDNDIDYYINNSFICDDYVIPTNLLYKNNSGEQLIINGDFSRNFIAWKVDNETYLFNRSSRLENNQTDNLNHILGEYSYLFKEKCKLSQKIKGNFKQGEKYNFEIWIKGYENNTKNLKLEIDNCSLNYYLLSKDEEYKPYIFSTYVLFDCNELELSISLEDDNQLYNITNLKLYKTMVLGENSSYNFTSFNVVEDNNRIKFEKTKNSIKEKFYYENGLLKEEVYCKTGNVIKYYYDNKRRLIKKEFILGNKQCYSHQFEYYDNDLLKLFIDENNNKTIYNYDCANRIMDIIYPNGQSIKYEYDDYSNILKSIYGVNDLLNVCNYTYINQLLNSMEIQNREKYEFKYDLLERQNEVNYYDNNENKISLNESKYVKFNGENQEFDNQSFDNIMYKDYNHGIISNENTYKPNEYKVNYERNSIVTSVRLNDSLYLQNNYNKDKTVKINYYYPNSKKEICTFEYVNEYLKSDKVENQVSESYKEVTNTYNYLENKSKIVSSRIGEIKMLSQPKSLYGHNIFDELEQFNNYYKNDYIIGVMSRPIYSDYVEYSNFIGEIDNKCNINVLSFNNQNQKIIMPLNSFNKNRVSDFDYTDKKYLNDSYLIKDNMDIVILFKVDKNNTSIFGYNYGTHNQSIIIDNGVYVEENTELAGPPNRTKKMNLDNFDMSQWHMLYASIRRVDLSLIFSYKIDNFEYFSEILNFENYSNLMENIPSNIILGSNTHVNTDQLVNKVQIAYFSICTENIEEETLNQLYQNINKYNNNSNNIIGTYSLSTTKEYDEIIFDNNLISLNGISPSKYNYKLDLNENKGNQLFSYDNQLEKNVYNAMITKDYQNKYNSKQIGYNLNLAETFNFSIKFKYYADSRGSKHTLFYSEKDNFSFHTYIENNTLKILYKNDSINELVVFNEIIINNNEWTKLCIKHFNNTFNINCNGIIINKTTSNNFNLNNETIYIGNSLKSIEYLDSDIEYLNGYIEYFKFSAIVDIDLYENEQIEVKKYYNTSGLIDKEVYLTNSTSLVKKYYHLDANFKNNGVPNVEENFDGSKTYYAYNMLGHLIKMKKINAEGVILTNKNYIYDDKGQLIKENDISLNKSIEYEYDSNGNIVHLLEFDSNNSLTTKLNYYYSSNAPYNLLSVKSENINGLETCLWQVEYVDENPFVLKKICHNNTNYDIEYYGKDISRIGSNTYYYDHLGHRIRKELLNDNYMNYYYCNNKIIHTDFNISDVSIDNISYLYDESDNLYALKMNNEYYFYDKDLTGTINGIVDNNGTCMVKYTYNAFGNPNIYIPLSTSDEKYSTAYNLSRVNIFLYKGYVYDVETQLYWVSSRYYSPELCRWILPDSIEYLDPKSINGLNLYAYCGNDPINKYDPTGHIAISTIIGIIIGVVALAATANDIYQIVRGEDNGDGLIVSVSGDNVHIKNSYKILTPWMRYGYSFYLNHFNHNTKDVIQGSTAGVQFEWELHNYAAWLGIGGDLAKHLDVGKSIFADGKTHPLRDEHGNITAIGVMSLGMRIVNIWFGNPIYWIWDLIVNGGF